MSTKQPADARLGALGIKSINLSDLMRGVIPQCARESKKCQVLLDLIRETRVEYRSEIYVTSPRNAGSYLLSRCQGWTEERFGMLALNAKGLIVADRIISQGTATATLVSPREFFREALRYGATSALAYHNHPSGDPTPSQEDVNLTRRLRTAGQSLGVPLADHLILGNDTWYSFRAAEGWDR